MGVTAAREEFGHNRQAVNKDFDFLDVATPRYVVVILLVFASTNILVVSLYLSPSEDMSSQLGLVDDLTGGAVLLSDDIL